MSSHIGSCTGGFDIVQETGENAFCHSHAKGIMRFGRLHQGEIDIRVGDDGIGFNSEINLKLDHMLANKHFGLVGMLERANSKPNQGTKIQVTWKSRESI